MPFKMHKIIFFPKKNIFKKKYVCLTYLKFSDMLPKTHLFFHLALPLQSLFTGIPAASVGIGTLRPFGTDCWTSLDVGAVVLVISPRGIS